MCNKPSNEPDLYDEVPDAELEEVLRQLREILEQQFNEFFKEKGNDKAS